MSTIETLDDAIDVYHRACERDGLIFDQPAHDSEYEPGRGWVLRNVNRELAVIREDGTFGELHDGS